MSTHKTLRNTDDNMKEDYDKGKVILQAIEGE